jgi:hypothetical protein
LWYSQNGDHPHRDLAKFGYKLNMKVKFGKHPAIFLATYLNHVLKNLEFFSQILVYSWLLKTLFKALLNFNFAF